MSLIEEGFDFNCAGSVPKIQKIYWADWYYFEGYDLDIDGVIQDLRAVPIWFELGIDYNTAEFTETREGNTYIQQFNMNALKSNQQKRNVLNNIRNRKMFCVFKDRNGIWWFAGEFGLKQNSQTRNLNGDSNSYDFNLITRSKVASREVLTSFANSIVLGPPIE
jgi:hypothetical protein